MRRNQPIDRVAAISLNDPWQLAVLVVVLISALSSAAQAITRTWNAGSGNWSAPGNWNPVGVPASAADSAVLTLVDGGNRTITYDYSGFAFTLNSLDINLLGFGGTANTTTLSMAANALSTAVENIGTSGRGVVAQSGGTHTVGPGNLYLGATTSGDGTYNLSGSGTLTVNGYEYVGAGGTGAFNQSGGTHAIAAGKFLDVGLGAGSIGSYNLSNGTLTAPAEYIGDSGTGHFVQTGGTNTINSVTGLWLGFNGGAGDYTMSGGSLTSQGTDTIAWLSPGTFTQSGGTHLNNGLSLGNNGRTGTYNLSSAATLGVFGSVHVGDSGPAVFNQSGGTHTMVTSLEVGYGATGTYNLSAGTVSAPAEYIGDSGTGHFVQTGGTNTVGTDGIILGFNGGAGDYTLSNGSLIVNGGETIGFRSAGTFTQSAGTHTVAFGTYIGRGGSTGTYNLSGTGALQLKFFDVGFDGPGTFNQSGGTVTVQSGQNFGVGVGAHGDYNLSNGNLTTIGGGGSLSFVGTGDIGVFTQSGGTFDCNNPLIVGYLVGSNGTYTLTGGTILARSNIEVGNQGIGTINQSSGVNHIFGELDVGEFTGARGTYNLSGGSLFVDHFVEVGLSGATGVVNVSGSAILTSEGIEVRQIAPGTALNLMGGRINTSRLELSGSPSVFNWTAGTLNFTSDIILDPGPSTLANAIAAFGASRTVTSNQTLMVTGNEGIGDTGAFSLTLAGGTHYVSGTLTLNPAGKFTQNAGSTLYATRFVQAGGTVNGTLQNQGIFEYRSGVFDASLLNQGTVSFGPSFFASGSILNEGDITLTAGQTVSATTIVNDRTFTFNNSTIAARGLVTNNVGGSMQGGGTIDALFENYGLLLPSGILRFTAFATNYGVTQGGGTILGRWTNAAGGTMEVPFANTLSVNHVTTETWSNAGLVTMSSGTLNGGQIDNTGTIQGLGTINSRIVNDGIVRSHSGQLTLGAANISNNAGGLIEASSASTVMVLQGLASNSGTISLTGGAFDNNNRPLANAAVINGYGTFRSGGLTNTGSINVGSGDMSIFGPVTNNGSVAIQAARSLYFYGSVNGAGIYTGSGSAVFLASFSPGNSPAAVNFGGNVALASALKIELGGTTAGTEFDKLLVTGNLALGGTLNISLINGFIPAANQSFDILDWGSLSGTFSAVQLPTLAGGLQWNTSQLYVTGRLSIAGSVGLAGDYNGNGVVDAADYVVWRKGLGTTYTQDDYNTWRANFGQTGGGLGGSAAQPSATVPETATPVLLLVGMLAMSFRRRLAASKSRKL